MKIHGVELRDEGDMVVQHFRQTGGFENDTIELWQRYCRLGSLVADVGAYTGLYSILARKCGARVRAFEPNTTARLRLLSNANHNGVSVDVSAAAVGAETSVVKFSTHGRSSMTSAGSVSDTGKAVAMTTLGATLRYADAIKIDVEGLEREVLVGARNIIEKCRPLIIAEALNDAAASAILDEMDRYGAVYRNQMLDGRNMVFEPK